MKTNVLLSIFTCQGWRRALCQCPCLMALAGCNVKQFLFLSCRPSARVKYKSTASFHSQIDINGEIQIQKHLAKKTRRMCLFSSNPLHKWSINVSFSQGSLETRTGQGRTLTCSWLIPSLRWKNGLNPSDECWGQRQEVKGSRDSSWRSNFLPSHGLQYFFARISKLVS